MKSIITVKNLTKSYGQTRAVDNLSFEMVPGKIYGLLGRNGAGKTTLINLLTSRIYASQGDIMLFGEPGIDNQTALSRICCMPDKNLFPPGLKVGKILRIAADFYPTFDMSCAASLSREFDLNWNNSYKSLSRGYESILRIIIGLASRCELTIFDEPVLGLDAAGRDLFYQDLIKEYSSAPRTFILSTHLIDESADIFEEALIIKDGKLVVFDQVEKLKKQATVISGHKDDVDAFTAKHRLQIFSAESLGRLAAVTAGGLLSDDVIRQGFQEGLDFSPVSLQKLFIHLTQAIERQVS